jgi:CRP-like cAMP-binding protein
VSLDTMDTPRRARRTQPGLQQKEVLARLFTRRSYPKDAVVLQRGETSDVFFVIIRGTIQISNEDEWGHTNVVSQGEGEVFGEEILLGGGQSSFQAMALEDSELILLDRSDLDELSARAPAILLEIMERVAGRLHSITGSLRNQSRQSREIQLRESPSFQAKAARFLADWGGTPYALALFVAALWGWLYFGNHGFPLLHLQPFDPSPFSMLGLLLKVIASVWAAIILLVLNRVPGLNKFEMRSRMKLLEDLKLVERALDRQQLRMGDRHVSGIENHERENSSKQPTLS